MAFEKILIPVDFSINTKIAITQAIDLGINAKNSIILLHVCPSSVRDEALLKADDQLKEYEHAIYELSSNTEVKRQIIKGSKVQRQISNYALNTAPDLIIIGKKSFHRLLPFLTTVKPSYISLSTSIPVLTISGNQQKGPLKTIVMPVGKTVPESKITMVKRLSKRHPLKINLVTVSTKHSGFSYNALAETYRILKFVTRTHVELFVLHEENIAKALIEHAHKVNADIILANPGSETMVSGLYNKEIYEYMSPEGNIQIMTVAAGKYASEPYLNKMVV